MWRLEDFIRDAAATFQYQTCTAKMSCDPLSVVDANLQMYGVRNLRIADASVMPRVTTGNTMLPASLSDSALPTYCLLPTRFNRQKLDGYLSGQQNQSSR